MRRPALTLAALGLLVWSCASEPDAPASFPCLDCGEPQAPGGDDPPKGSDDGTAPGDPAGGLGGPGGAVRALVGGLCSTPGGAAVPGVEVASAATGEVLTHSGTGGFWGIPATAGQVLSLRFRRDGYTTAYRIVVAAGPGFTPTDVLLLPRGAAGSFEAETGGEVAVPGARIAFLPGAIVDESGQPLSGLVEVALTPVDVTTDAMRAAPESLLATGADGTQGILRSFGMVEAVLTSGGKPAQLAPGATAAVTLSLPDGLGVTEGETIEAWRYLPEQGQWTQRGAGTIVPDPEAPSGLAFAFEADHFSWWNCDKIDAVGCVHVTVVDELGMPVAASVAATGSQPGMYGVVQAHGAKGICLAVMRGTTVVLKAAASTQAGASGVLAQVEAGSAVAWLTGGATVSVPDVAASCTQGGCVSVTIVVTPGAIVCGDGSCDGPVEDCFGCPADCGHCGCCGDGTCVAGKETCSSCKEDCGSCAACGDGKCDKSESCQGCPKDCGPCADCGDGVCAGGSESCLSCPADCGDCGGCSASPSPGCGGCGCEASVCASIPACCTSAWALQCAALCQSQLGTCPSSAADSKYPPCSALLPATPTAGCGQCACEACVCARDPYCCATAWDDFCNWECYQDCL